MSLKLKTGPADEPFTLAEVKSHLRLEDTADDALLVGLIVAARELAESFTHRALITQTWTLFLDRFPAGARDPWWDGVVEAATTELVDAARPIVIPKPPLQTITFVKAHKQDGTAETVAAADYWVDTASEPGRVTLKTGKTWPTSAPRTQNAVEVEFVAGYGSDRLSVPEPIKQGMLMLIGRLYENRGDEATASLSPAVRALWRSYVVRSL